MQNLREELPYPKSFALQPDGTYQNQSYVTPYFDKVSNWFSDDEWAKLLQIAKDHYPTPTMYAQQIENMVNLCASMTNEQKMLAEIWEDDPSHEVAYLCMHPHGG